MGKKLTRLDLITDAMPDETFLKVDGFDHCVIGHCSLSNNLVYSVKLIMQTLRKNGLNYLEAREHFDFNIAGAFMGEQTPIFCEDEY